MTPHSFLSVQAPVQLAKSWYLLLLGQYNHTQWLLCTVLLLVIPLYLSSSSLHKKADDTVVVSGALMTAGVVVVVVVEVVEVTVGEVAIPVVAAGIDGEVAEADAVAEEEEEAAATPLLVLADEWRPDATRWR